MTNRTRSTSLEVIQAPRRVRGMDEWWDAYVADPFNHAPDDIVDLILDMLYERSEAGDGDCANLMCCSKDMKARAQRLWAPKRRSYALRWCSLRGYANAVKELLVHTSADPTEKGSMSLMLAVRNGHAQTVQYLLEDGRCNPMARGGHALALARSKGRADIVALLRTKIKERELQLRAQWGVERSDQEAVHLGLYA